MNAPDKPLISKEKFVEIINFMRERDTAFELIASAMEKVCPGFSVDFVPNLSYNGKITDILNLFFPDEQEDSLIDYYVYEANYGTERGMEFIIVDGKEYDITTPEQLYDALVDLNFTRKKKAGKEEIK